MSIKNKAASLIEEFKAFAFKGNIVDMAIGIIIGAAFGKIVNSFVNDIVMPLVTAIITKCGGQDAGEGLKMIRQGTAALTTLGGAGEALGGYKGYGYAMVVELLSAILQDGNYGKMLDGKDENGNLVPYHLGHFFIAIDTDHFLGEELARKKAGEIIRSVRNSTKAPGAERIYTANEKEWDVWLYRKDKGVPITEPVQKEIVAVRDELGLTQYKFPWED